MATGALTIAAPAPLQQVSAPVSTGLAGQQLNGIAPLSMPTIGSLTMQAPQQQVIMGSGAQSGNPIVSGMTSGLASMGFNDMLKNTAAAGYGGALAQFLQGNPTGAAIQGAGTYLGSQLAGTPFQAAGPYVGSALNLIHNGINSSTLGSTGGGGAGYYAGNAIGTYFGGPIGGQIGGVIGSTIGSVVGSGCFITQAVMAAVGKGDAAHELQILRAFRDGYMMRNPQLAPLVKEYYQLAPLVVQALSRRPDAQQIYVAIYQHFLLPAIQAVLSNDYPKALEIYAAMLKAVSPLAQQAEPNPINQAGINQLGNHSAQVQGALSLLRGAQ